MAKRLLGAPVAAAITEDVKGRADALGKVGVKPTLAIVRVGERGDDLAYERGAKKRAEASGVTVRVYELSADCDQGALDTVLDSIMADDTIHGCLLFRPLPKGLDEHEALLHITAEKDVDGATQASLFGVFASQMTGFPPCTAEAVIAIIEHYGYALDGANVTIIGRSLIIGRPVAMMLLARNATPTICHTHTNDVDDCARRADLIVVSAGHANTLAADSVRPGQVIIDVGINFDDKTNKMVGDVDFDAVEPIVEAITPVPGGVGATTTAVLMRHVVEAAERSLGHE